MKKIKTSIKIMIASAIFSMAFQLIQNIFSLLIYGNEKVPMYGKIWMASNIGILVLCGLLLVIINFKSIKNFILYDVF